VSANLIGFGADLQQKLDAMDPKLRKARWAGDVGVALYRIARRLHQLRADVRRGGSTRANDRAEQELMEKARRETNKLGQGIVVVRQPDPRGWPLVIVFSGDVSKGSGPEAAFEQGVAVPPRP
jgi:hypothetical protein